MPHISKDSIQADLETTVIIVENGKVIKVESVDANMRFVILDKSNSEFEMLSWPETQA